MVLLSGDETCAWADIFLRRIDDRFGIRYQNLDNLRLCYRMRSFGNNDERFESVIPECYRLRYDGP